jgi:hypothetical protein
MINYIIDYTVLQKNKKFAPFFLGHIGLHNFDTLISNSLADFLYHIRIRSNIAMKFGFFMKMSIFVVLPHNKEKLTGSGMHVNL